MEILPIWRRSQVSVTIHLYKKFISLAVAVFALVFAIHAETAPQVGMLSQTSKPTHTLWTSLYDQETPHYDEPLLRTQYFTNGYEVFSEPSLVGLQLTGYTLTANLNASFTPADFGPFHDLFLVPNTSGLNSQTDWENDPNQLNGRDYFGSGTTCALSPNSYTVTWTGDAAAAFKLQSTLATGNGNFAFLVQQEFGPDAYYKTFGFDVSTITLTVTAAVPEPSTYILLVLGLVGLVPLRKLKMQ